MAQAISTGPSTLPAWLNFWSSSSSTGMSANAFNFNYLLMWGGKYGPSIGAGQWYRWLTSLVLHQSFSHVVSNMVLFLILSGYLEHNYGTIRIFVIFVASGGYMSGVYTIAPLYRRGIMYVTTRLSLGLSVLQAWPLTSAVLSLRTPACSWWAPAGARLGSSVCTLPTWRSTLSR